MSLYTIPPTIKEKEKVIGGVLDLAQAAWLISGAALGLVVFLLLAPVNKVLGGIFGVVFATTGVPFAFVKIRGYKILTYLKYKKQFDKKEKYLPNKRKF